EAMEIMFQKELIKEQTGCCETAGLFHRALEHYIELADIIRCIAHTDQIPAEFIVIYVGQISKQKEPKYGYECLRVLSRSKNNVRLCTDIANSWAGKVFNRREIIHIFEENKMIEAVYLHLKSIASTLEENEFLMENNLPDSKSLMILCDKHNFVLSKDINSTELS
ncbi:MAG: hypothetical protein EZS28_046110, partial [Streblomastix strix]